jgi:hypothetical protein
MSSRLLIGTVFHETDGVFRLPSVLPSLSVSVSVFILSMWCPRYSTQSTVDNIKL